MRFLLAEPTRVQQLDLNELMLALGPEKALEVSRLAESEPVVQVTSDPIRLVRLMAPGDEGLTFAGLLEMLSSETAPPRVPALAPRFPVQEKPKAEADDGDEEDDEESQGTSVTTLGAHIQSRLVERMKDRDEPFTIAEVVELMVEDHQSEAFAYREVSGELTIKVPVKLLVAAARSDKEASDIVQAFTVGDPLEVGDGQQQCGILWDPVRLLMDAQEAINRAPSPADAGWSIEIEETRKLTPTAMRALARRITMDLVERIQAARLAAQDRNDALVANAIRQITQGT